VTQHKVPQVLLETDDYTISSFPLKHRIATTGFLFEEKEQARKLNKTVADAYGVPVCDYHWIKDGKDWTSEEGQLVPNKELTFDPPPPLSYAFASDTMYTPDTATYIQGVDLLYHESTFCEDKAKRAQETMHSTAKEAASVAKEAGVAHLLLGHFSARYRDFHQFKAEASEVFDSVYLAKELYSYRLNSNGLKVESLIANAQDEE